MSSRTRSKVIKRMKLSCFSCGWDKTTCDIHHIVPSSKGGTDSHNNLTNLCPNCHRLAHEGKLVSFDNLEDKIGDTWKEFYQVKHSPTKFNKEANARSAETRKENSRLKAKIVIDMIKNSGVDLTKRGWVTLVCNLTNIRHQHLARFLKKYDVDFYNSCYHADRRL